MQRFLKMLTIIAMCSSIQPAFSAKSDKDMIATFKSSKKFAYLSDSLARIDKTKLLRGPGPFTFFVPENDAFDDLEYGKWVEVWNNKPLLNKILMRGLVKGRFDKKSFEDGSSLSTANGGMLKIEKRDGRLWIGNSRIVDTDIECSNGIVHVLSKFLSKDTDPKNAADFTRHSKLLHPVSQSRKSNPATQK
ncbi:MAG TPA: fasciclin domain-containing protein [Drouetiella sp.]